MQTQVVTYLSLLGVAQYYVKGRGHYMDWALSEPAVKFILHGDDLLSFFWRTRADHAIDDLCRGLAKANQ